MLQFTDEWLQIYDRAYDFSFAAKSLKKCGIFSPKLHIFER